jgi:hypothetical protein
MGFSLDESGDDQAAQCDLRLTYHLRRGVRWLSDYLVCSSRIIILETCLRTKVVSGMLAGRARE